MPVFNEQGNLRPLYEKVVAALEHQPQIDSFELIFVDDASTDRSLDECRSISDTRVRTIPTPKRQGQTLAMKQGFDAARFDVIGTLDADLQNDPVDFPGMINLLDKGHDFIQGWRVDRHDSGVRKLSSFIANSVRRFVLRDTFHDSGCSTRVFKKKVVQNIEFFNGAHRFLAYLAQQQGFSVAEHPVHHHPRTIGVSKYNIRNRLFKAFGDMVRLKMKKRPFSAEKHLFLY